MTSLFYILKLDQLLELNFISKEKNNYHLHFIKFSKCRNDTLDWRHCGFFTLRMYGTNLR